MSETWAYRDGRRPRMENHLQAPQWIAMRRFEGLHGATHQPVVHDHATVVLYLAGRAKFWMHGIYDLAPGDVLLVPAGMPHHRVEDHDVRSLGLSLSLVAMGPGRDELVAVFEGIRRGACATRHLNDEATAQLARVLEALAIELDLAEPSALAVGAHLSLMTVAILRALTGPAAERPTAASPLVARVLDFIHRQALEGISLREVADHIGRSPSHVASHVKDHTGVTVGSWIARARIAESCRLLRHTDETIENVAERCAFQSPSHFSRAFKRIHGVPPGAWRRANRSET